MDIIDTHCHLDLPVFDVDRSDILISCRSKGLNHIIIPAIDRQGWSRLIQLSSQYKQLKFALGLHPVFIESHTDDDLVELEQTVEQQLSHKRLVAIGEIGLDYYLEELDINKQKYLFEKQLQIAEQFNLPVILHVRKAHDDTLSILKKYRINGGTCHAFNGSMQQATRYIDMGFKLGFGGTMTYPNASKIHQLARELPLDSIVLETDAPDMSGYNHQGERNQPDYIRDALQALSQLRKLPEQEIAEQTSRNARQVFQLD